MPLLRNLGSKLEPKLTSLAPSSFPIIRVENGEVISQAWHLELCHCNPIRDGDLVWCPARLVQVHRHGAALGPRGPLGYGTGCAIRSSIVGHGRVVIDDKVPNHPYIAEIMS